MKSWNTARVVKSDVKDTVEKSARVRSMAATDRDFAIKCAKAMASDPCLMDGNMAVLQAIAKFPEVRTILEQVMGDAWVRKFYKEEVNAFTRGMH